MGKVYAQEPAGIRNIVLVHGAFVDGSGWKPVYDILVKRGYHVSVTQQPLTAFEVSGASHSVYESRPEEVARLIMQAAAGKK